MSNQASSHVLEAYNFQIGWLIFGTILMTAGTVFLMWIGEQIDAYGIGNGISLLIMAGILARVPQIVWKWVDGIRQDGLQIGSKYGIELLLGAGVLFGGKLELLR